MSAEVAPGLWRAPATGGHDWIALHRMRLVAPIAARDRSFAPVANAVVWRFCPQHTPGEDGLVTLTPDICCGMGIWDSLA